MMVYGIILQSKPELLNRDLYYIHTKLHNVEFRDMHILYRIDKTPFTIEEATFLKLQGIKFENFIY